MSKEILFAMQMVEHILTIEGPRAGGGHPPIEVISEVLRRVTPLAAGAVSMAFRRATSVRGPVPGWLRRASDIRVTDVTGGSGDSTLLVLESPCFGDAAEELYQQKELFESKPPAADTAFDLLGSVLGDVRQERAESERFDIGLLRRVEMFRKTFDIGLDDVVISGHHLDSTAPARIDRVLTESARKLHIKTPPVQRVRVAGKLDMIRDSDRVFGLLMDDGMVVRGIWLGEDMSLLGKLFRRNVVAEGKGVFRPSGLLLRVEAEIVSPANAGDQVFGRVPTAALGKLDIKALRKPTGRGQGVDAIFGRWPGEESDEELDAALRDQS